MYSYISDKPEINVKYEMIHKKIKNEQYAT